MELLRLVAVGATPTHSAVSVGYADPRRVRSYAEVVAAPFLAESRGSKRTLSTSGRTLTLRQCPVGGRWGAERQPRL